MRLSILGIKIKFPTHIFISSLTDSFSPSNNSTYKPENVYRTSARGAGQVIWNNQRGKIRADYLLKLYLRSLRRKYVSWVGTR